MLCRYRGFRLGEIRDRAVQHAGQTQRRVAVGGINQVQPICSKKFAWLLGFHAPSPFRAATEPSASPGCKAPPSSPSSGSKPSGAWQARHSFVAEEHRARAAGPAVEARPALATLTGFQLWIGPLTDDDIVKRLHQTPPGVVPRALGVQHSENFTVLPDRDTCGYVDIGMRSGVLRARRLRAAALPGGP